ncbi:MAG: symmetrical bis(5'-nucleosyl)-tetraphosphatase [Gammaproteobacteria bacterium]
MATWAIGDIQGCHDELLALLETIKFSEESDTLLFTGDLVNRGPRSLDTLRFVHALGECATVVLGNHDLHLLAIAAGIKKPRPGKDTLDAILVADDRDELLHWLRHRPLLHDDTKLGYTLVHAGLPPQWDIQMAKSLANEVAQCLQSDDYVAFLQNMYGNSPDRWSDGLRGHERLRFAINCFTRLRFCNETGQLDLDSKGPVGSQPPGFLPWFRVPGRASAGIKIIFGHWSALGEIDDPNLYPLDSGCLWGGALTAMRLDGAAIRVSLPCQAKCQAGKETPAN